MSQTLCVQTELIQTEPTCTETHCSWIPQLSSLPLSPLGGPKALGRKAAKQYLLPLYYPNSSQASRLEGTYLSQNNQPNTHKQQFKRITLCPLSLLHPGSHSLPSNSLQDILWCHLVLAHIKPWILLLLLWSIYNTENNLASLIIMIVFCVLLPGLWLWPVVSPPSF